MDLSLGLPQLAIPLLLLVAVNGYRRGWKQELATAGAIFFAIFLLDRGGSVLVRLANRVPAIFLMLASAGTESADSTQVHALDAPQVVTPTNQVVLYGLAFLGLVVFAYWIGGVLDRAGGLNGLGRFGGAVIAPFNAFIAVERLSWYWRVFSQARGGPRLDSTVTINLQSNASGIDFESYLPALLVTSLIGFAVFLLVRWRMARG